MKSQKTKVMQEVKEDPEYYIELSDISSERLVRFAKCLEKVPKDLNRPKIFFSGFTEFDTKYQKLAGHLKIGAISSNEKTGYVLLKLLNFIFDRKLSLVSKINLSDESKDEDFYQVLSEPTDEESTFKLHQTFSSKVYNYDPEERKTTTKTIEKTIDEVDAWTLKRIIKELSKL